MPNIRDRLSHRRMLGSGRTAGRLCGVGLGLRRPSPRGRYRQAKKRLGAVPRPCTPVGLCERDLSFARDRAQMMEQRAKRWRPRLRPRPARARGSRGAARQRREARIGGVWDRQLGPRPPNPQNPLARPNRGQNLHSQLSFDMTGVDTTAGGRGPTKPCSETPVQVAGAALGRLRRTKSQDDLGTHALLESLA
jgi:hypothetical protein